MAGNVYEWVADWYDSSYYDSAPDSNPQGPSTGELRVHRGGSWHNSWFYLRAAYRNKNNPDFRDESYGFRCARSASTLTHTPQPLTATPRVNSTPTPTETTSLGIGSTKVSPVDAMSMVYIPEGEFLMGSEDSDTDAGYDEKPQHRVYLDAFWIDQTEVTNEMFAAFLNAEGNLKEDGVYWLDAEHEEGLIILSDSEWEPKANYEDYPVTLVTRYGAQAYCEWAGRRLPTEAEWEKAARGVDLRIYPWGNDFDCSKGNFDDESDNDVYVIPGGPGCDGYDRTAPVGSYPAGASPYGALDMAGNVWEWVADWYADDYYDRSPYSNPAVLTPLDCSVVRGGSWDNDIYELRSAYRSCDSPTSALNINGFRCALSAVTSETTPLGTGTPPPVPDTGEIEVPMVLVPAGSFEMGSQDGDANESPVHVVSLDDFYIDTYEVTNALFANFLNQMGNQEQGGSTWLEVDRPEVRIHHIDGAWQADAGFADHPVVKVSWEGAHAYCEWRGADLPTEAQWEKAARGGLQGARYPWGDESPLCQQGVPNGAKFDDDAGCNDTDTASVGSYSSNGYGLYDMAGNAWEWVSDWFADSYYAESPIENPNGPESGERHVIRGGSAYDAAHHLRVAGRVKDKPEDRLALVSFRCASSP
jgi:formylglycine-generating enzyme required for sulfatase activity